MESSIGVPFTQYTPFCSSMEFLNLNVVNCDPLTGCPPNKCHITASISSNFLPFFNHSKHCCFRQSMTVPFIPLMKKIWSPRWHETIQQTQSILHQAIIGQRKAVSISDVSQILLRLQL